MFPNSKITTCFLMSSYIIYFTYYFLFRVISLDDDEPPTKAVETRIETQNSEIRTLIHDFR
jgi:hypothetical protein